MTTANDVKKSKARRLRFLAAQAAEAGESFAVVATYVHAAHIVEDRPVTPDNLHAEASEVYAAHRPD